MLRFSINAETDQTHNHLSYPVDRLNILRRIDQAIGKTKVRGQAVGKYRGFQLVDLGSPCTSQALALVNQHQSLLEYSAI